MKALTEGLIPRAGIHDLQIVSPTTTLDQKVALRKYNRRRLPHFIEFQRRTFFAEFGDQIRANAGYMPNALVCDIDEVFLAKKFQRFYGLMHVGPLGDFVATMDGIGKMAVSEMRMEEFLGPYDTLRSAIQNDQRYSTDEDTFRQTAALMEAHYNHISRNTLLYSQLPPVRHDLPEIVAQMPERYEASLVLLQTGTPEAYRDPLRTSLQRVGIPDTVPMVMKPAKYRQKPFQHSYLFQWKAAIGANVAAILPDRNVFVLDDHPDVCDLINGLRRLGSPLFGNVYAVLIDQNSPDLENPRGYNFDNLALGMADALTDKPRLRAR